jgi:hypothetical protein
MMLSWSRMGAGEMEAMDGLKVKITEFSPGLGVVIEKMPQGSYSVRFLCFPALYLAWCSYYYQNRTKVKSHNSQYDF